MGALRIRCPPVLLSSRIKSGSRTGSFVDDVVGERPVPGPLRPSGRVAVTLVAPLAPHVEWRARSHHGVGAPTTQSVKISAGL
ncbi:hypothetical protein E2562_023752 [Oryza meyeriana var. granulata]|uniref:Uncharacterized protein n=1 Tax=Oryza meyeriana var. granulata TaxID=110450 RepID=A0A6G1DM01_9ORYZ|nr:hypothetical protein E2562_023752 [Oryza meyeriana var. granulata]